MKFLEFAVDAVGGISVLIGGGIVIGIVYIIDWKHAFSVKRSGPKSGSRVFLETGSFNLRE